jgi:signal transduction histidine kinase
VVVWGFVETERIRRIDTALGQAQRLAVDLISLSFELRQWPGVRPGEQWRRRHRRLSAELEALRFSAPQPRQLLAGARAGLDTQMEQFAGLAQLGEGVAEPAAVAEQEYRNIRFQHLLVEQYELVDTLERLRRHARTRLADAGRLNGIALAVATLLLLVVVLGMLLLLHRRLLRPLHGLGEQVRRYGEGDLDARSTVAHDDELGDLSRGFNALGAALSRTMTDRGALEQEVARREQVEAEQRALLADLKRSNAELEQFAYVASHDLQEPLRTVTSFVQLIERRYGARLDDEGRELIAFAVDGASRMRTLIDDLLTFSRVSTRGRPFEPVDVGRLVEQMRHDLAPAIADADAEIVVGPLPTVPADPVQLRQLLDNLVLNALRYRDQAPAHIRIDAEPAAPPEQGWVFAVSDNGIGIAPEYFERIFRIFQRLHTRKDYPGTGIGLAVCKRIVERHGGRIWVESAVGAGATFSFFIPAAPRSPAGPTPEDQGP